jgi:hypothetical protein
MSFGTPNNRENTSSGTHSVQGRITSSRTLSEFWDGRRWAERPLITLLAGVILPGQLQPALQSSRRRFGFPEIEATFCLNLSVFFTRQQVRESHNWMRLNPTLPPDLYREIDRHNVYARKYVAWTLDFLQEPTQTG